MQRQRPVLSRDEFRVIVADGLDRAAVRGRVCVAFTVRLMPPFVVVVNLVIVPARSEQRESNNAYEPVVFPHCLVLSELF